MDRCKNGYIINEDGTIPERCHVDWDDGFYPTVCKECPFYNSEYFMNTSEAINLLEVIKFCDVDELSKIKAINMAISVLQKQEKTIKDLKYYLDINEENGVVYIPKFVIEKIVRNT